MKKSKNKMTILVHLPAYREPELIPTIKSALENAKNPERIHFGICRQFNPEDGFDNVDEYRDDPRFKIKDIPYEEAKGLAYARGVINDDLLTDEDFVCQLDSHHRFSENWDETKTRHHNRLNNLNYSYHVKLITRCLFPASSFELFLIFVGILLL